MAQLERDVTDRHRPLGKNGRQLAADHQLNQLFPVHVPHRSRVHRDTVPQHGHAVGDEWQFLEAMGDVDHSDAIRSQLADDTKEILRVGIA